MSTHLLSEIPDLRLFESEVLHLLLQFTHASSFDLQPLHVKTSLLESYNHAFLFAWKQEEQAFPFRLIPRCSAYSVNVGIDIVRTVQLDHPVDEREIESAGGNIGTHEQGCGRGGEAFKCGQAGLLFLLANEVK